MSHVLDSIVVFDPDGRPVRMGTLWADRTAVLMFVRHFGCLFCRQQIADIRPFLDRIRACGAELVVIGPGSIEEARVFRDEQRGDFPLLTDPDRQAYRALEMRHGLGSILGLPVLMRSLNALKAGFRQSRVAGDPLQQGGVVVIAPGGVERLRIISRHAGDHPTPAQILAAL
jgi:AhpC/TSA antioxidant enzyme